MSDSIMIEKTSKIYVAGHSGMVGSAIVRKLKNDGYLNLILRSYEELDLTNQKAVIDFFSLERPEYVFIAAAKVGGIMANNTYRAQFIYENLMIQNNIIHNSYFFGVKKLIFLGSSCIYPKNCPQPIKEEYILTGTLEQTNEPYAIAKIAGLKMCESYSRQYGCNFISAMPTNLYGYNDNYNLENSHVVPGILRKIYLGSCLERNDWESIKHDLNKRPIGNISGKSSSNKILQVLKNYGIYFISSKKNSANSNVKNIVAITLWGSGKVYREFMHVDDMANAVVFLMKNVNFADLYAIPKLPDFHPITAFINIGTGEDIKIKDLAIIIKNITNFKGKLLWDKSKPDGTPKKLLDITKISQYGFTKKYNIEQGLQLLFKEYRHN
jgi:GDP-L-fucose synthase